MAGATGYDVYFAKSNSSDIKLYRSVGGATTRIKISGLSKGVSYKAYVRARNVNTSIGEASPIVHAIAGDYNSKYCNAKSVKVAKARLTLKVGGTFRIKASVQGVRADRKVLKRENVLRYYSSNKNVATVSKTSGITATGAGSCAIYVLANNGIRASVKVTVK